LELEYVELLSSFAFNFNLRRYSKGDWDAMMASIEPAAADINGGV
jgi:hypothetical protein